MGPEARADSWPSGTSVTPSVTFIAADAATASRPPFTAERCFRTALISSIEAPQSNQGAIQFAAFRPASRRGSRGVSTSAEPPPDNRKKTRSRERVPASRSRIARPAARLPSSGSGCPPAIMRITGQHFLRQRRRDGNPRRGKIRRKRVRNSSRPWPGKLFRWQ